MVSVLKTGELNASSGSAVRARRPFMMKSVIEEDDDLNSCTGK